MADKKEIIECLNQIEEYFKCLKKSRAIQINREKKLKEKIDMVYKLIREI